MPNAVPLSIRLNPKDNVVVARVDLVPGSLLPEDGVTCRQAVPWGHKVATAPIRAGEAVRKYGQIIGFASRDIRAGEHVHTHNLAMGAATRDYAIGQDVRTPPAANRAAASFWKPLRAAGRKARPSASA